MFGIRTPIKGRKPTDEKQSPSTSGHGSGQAPPSQIREEKTPETHPASVRRSVGEWELGKSAEAPKKTTAPPKKAGSVEPQKPRATRTISQDGRATVTQKALPEAPGLPVKIQTQSFVDRVAEAEVLRAIAKGHLEDSKNIKTEIKTEVWQVVVRLHKLVKEAESGKGQGIKKANEPENQREPEKEKKAEEKPEKEQRKEEKELLRRIEEHTRLIKESNEKMERLKETIEKHQDLQEKMSYASVAAAHPRKQHPEQTALHSVVITAKDETETGEEILKRIREVVKAKDGGIEVERIRKGKDRKVIVGCRTEKDREQIKERLRGEGALNVQEVKNKDPLVILKDVFMYNTDEDIIGALWKQNTKTLKDLNKKENRVEVLYKKRSRNPQANSVIMRVSPGVWKRLVDAETVMIDLQRVRVADQSPLVQCSLCLGYGHGRRFCKDTVEKCSHCGGPHKKADCADWLAGEAPSCCNCQRAKMDRAEHNAFSSECPIRRRWETIARATIAYQC